MSDKVANRKRGDMKWTREKPTEEGFYWYYNPEWERVCLVRIDKGFKGEQFDQWYHGNECEDHLRFISGYWSAEPIPVPDIPREEE